MLSIASFLLMLICVPRRDRHPPPSLSRHAARHDSRYIRSAEKDHRLCTFGQTMRWSALSDKLCLFWRPVIACKSYKSLFCTTDFAFLGRQTMLCVAHFAQ